jgi:hypothetical protein
MGKMHYVMKLKVNMVEVGWEGMWIAGNWACVGFSLFGFSWDQVGRLQISFRPKGGPNSLICKRSIDSIIVFDFQVLLLV